MSTIFGSLLGTSTKTERCRIASCSIEVSLLFRSLRVYLRRGTLFEKLLRRKL